MVRKWSYINNISTFFKLNNDLSNFKRHFKFKLFRKNTRFKFKGLYFTNFNRKQVIITKRRTNLKLYIVLSSNWVKPILNYKHIINFIQTKFLFQVSFPYAYNNITKVSNKLKDLLGLGLYGINVVRLKSKFFKNFLPINSKLPLDNTNITYNNKFFSSVLLYSINHLTKLNNIKFLLTSIEFTKNYFPYYLFSKNFFMQKNYYNMYSKVILLLVLKICVFLRKTLSNIYIPILCSLNYNNNSTLNIFKNNEL